VVAAAAARILTEADRAVEEIHLKAERAAADLRRASEVARIRDESAHAIADVRVELETELRSDRVTMAEIKQDLGFVHSQLGQINRAIIGLQANGLRQTGVAALALAVLIAIAWKVIGG
jgi:hypothetical protein